jgi:hypothetical protein
VTLPPGAAPPAFTRRDGAGLLLVSGAIVALELALVRIFSVLMGQHLVSLIVSLALFGLAAGGLAVLLAPGRFPPGRTPERLSAAAAAFALAVLAGWAFFFWLGRSPLAAHRLLAPLHEPFFEPFARPDSGAALALPALALYLVAAVPFAVGGLVAALALARHPQAARAVCAWDLAGAGLGAAGGVLLLSAVDPFSALAALAATGALAAALFAPPGRRRAASWSLALLCAALAAASAGAGLVELKFVRGTYEPELGPIRWNAWSRVAAYPLRSGQVAGSFGTSRRYRGPFPEQRGLVVDDTGYTAVTRFAPGDDAGWARWNLLALPYLLRPDPAALVVGPGGGRDILVAKAMGAASVRAVEINPLVVRVVQQDLGGFSGRPYTLPGVEAVVEDARTFLARDRDRYDVLAATLVYGPSSPAGGAFTFSEEHLYTVEAFDAFLARLRPGGLLAIARFAREKALPRIVATAAAALAGRGAAAPAAHFFVAAERGLALVIVKESPFTVGEVALLERVCRELDFDVEYSPARDPEGPLYGLLRGGAGAPDYPFDVSPATDDRPFVHAAVRAADLLAAGARDGDTRAVLRLRDVCAALLLGALLVAALPLAAGRRTPGLPRRAALPALGFFAATGLGFAAAEVLLLKHFLLLVGKPVPAVAAVLAGLLVAAGAGSLRSGGWPLPATLRRRCAQLTIVLLVGVVLLPALVELALPLPAALRLLVAAAVSAAAGFLLGRPLPAAVAIAGLRDPRLVPWAWSVSGAAAALGSAAVLLIAVFAGYTEAGMLAPAGYLVAAALADVL